MAWNHKIEIDPFDPDSIDKAIKKLDEIQKQFDVKVEQFLKEVCDCGRDAAQAAYGSHISVVSNQVSSTEWAIVAEGTALYIFEFGAGDATDVTNRYANEVEGLEVRPGSYSEQHAKMYSTMGKWKFGGQWYKEVQPKRGMVAAYEAITLDWRDIAERVFRQ